jgi:hypothetical protein
MAEPAPVPSDASKRDPGVSGVSATVSASKTESTSSDGISERTVVINLGQASKKQIKKLKRGEGSLIDEVRRAVELAAANMGDAATGKVLVPTVLVYREKPAEKVRRGGTFGMCPICCV